jgi:hypothetical protein
MAMLNSLRSGKFSSDRTIREYAREIWDIEPCQIPKPAQMKSERRIGSIVWSLVIFRSKDQRIDKH